jgi:hypothetical protein
LCWQKEWIFRSWQGLRWWTTCHRRMPSVQSTWEWYLCNQESHVELEDLRRSWKKIKVVLPYFGSSKWLFLPHLDFERTSIRCSRSF